MTISNEVLAQQIGYMRQDIGRLDKRISGKVGADLYRRELDDMKDNIDRIEKQYQKIIDNQLTSQRQSVAQLVAIIVTLVVAAIGALT